MVRGTMATLFEKLTSFLDRSREFHYIRDDHRMEIWASAREELPIVVANIGDNRYIISFRNLTYELIGEEHAYRYIMQMFFCKDGTSNDY